MAGSYKGLSLCIINGVSVGVGKQQRGWHDSKSSRRLTQSTIQKTLCEHIKIEENKWMYHDMVYLLLSLGQGYWTWQLSEVNWCDYFQIDLDPK